MKARVFGRGAALILLLAALMSMAGCNTVAGFGQDIHDSARTVQHAL